MSDWQPIETAPKDGEKVLITDGKSILIAAWQDCQAEYDKVRLSNGKIVTNRVFHPCWCIVDGYNDEYGEYPTAESPAHWMPLPELPK
jgi:hypothetical protein